MKFKSTHCTSHIIEERKLLQVVKDDLKGLSKINLKLDKLYGIAEKKASSFNSSLEKDLKQIERQLKEVNKRFDNILSLQIEGHITIVQFKAQNDRIAQQQQDLSTKKAELQSALETRKDTSEQLQFFRNEVERFVILILMMKRY